MKHVILDNGHGIDTPGKRSPKGLLTKGSDVLFREFEFNRDIIDRVSWGLNLEDVQVHILVPEIEDIPLPERVRRANQLNRIYRDSIFGVSVHANAGGGQGYEVFTSKGDTPSDPMATLMYSDAVDCKLFPRFRKDTVDGDPDKEANFYILKHTNCPWVLPEFGFMDNAVDLAFISSSKGREKIAEHLSRTIMGCAKLL